MSRSPAPRSPVARVASTRQNSFLSFEAEGRGQAPPLSFYNRQRYGFRNCTMRRCRTVVTGIPSERTVYASTRSPACDGVNSKSVDLSCTGTTQFECPEIRNDSPKIRIDAIPDHDQEGSDRRSRYESDDDEPHPVEDTRFGGRVLILLKRCAGRHRKDGDRSPTERPRTRPALVTQGTGALALWTDAEPERCARQLPDSGSPRLNCRIIEASLALTTPSQFASPLEIRA